MSLVEIAEFVKQQHSIKVRPCRVSKWAAFYCTSGAALRTFFHSGAFMQTILESTWPSKNEVIGKTSNLTQVQLFFLKALHARPLQSPCEYKPGAAIGSTGGRGSARNQSETLRTRPCTGAVGAQQRLVQQQSSHFRFLSRAVSPSPSRLNWKPCTDVT